MLAWVALLLPSTTIADQPEDEAASPAPDRVQLDDGSRLVGAIQRLGDGTLVIDTSFAPGLEIPAARIASIETSDPRAVVIESGDRLVGRLAVVNGQQRVLGTSVGDADVAIQAIVGIRPPEDAAARPEAVRQEMEQKVDQLQEEHEAELAQAREEAAKPPTLRDLWSARIELGLNGQSGNSDRIAFRGRGELRRETDSERLLIFAEGNFASEDGDRTVNEIYGGVRGEVDVSDRTFVFGRARFEFDEFEDLDLRSTVTGGIGHFVVQREDLEFKVRGGGGFQHESFDTGVSETSGLLEAGYDFRADIIEDRARLTHSLTYLPNAGSPIDEYRLEIDSAVELPIGGGDTGWSLRGGVRNEFDNDPEPGVDKLDTSFFVNLVYLWD